MTPKPTILVVDDNTENIDILNGMLKPFYKVKAALNGELGLKIACILPKPDLILLDVMMPKMDGNEVCRRLKANPVTCDIPVIFVTAKAEMEDEKFGLELGAVDYITKPVSLPIVLARIRTHLALYDQQRELELKVRERTKELQNTRIEILRCLGRAAEFKDNETGLHVYRMSLYSKIIAEGLGAAPAWINLVLNAAPMHDIGKIGIMDKILLKPGRFNDAEWKKMQRHVEYGADILGNNTSPVLNMAKEICLGHHEKFNGTGYPNQVIGKKIPLSARIVAIADVFDALTSSRPYKKAWPLEDAVNYINEQSGKHFDPDLVVIFNRCLPQIETIMKAHSEEEKPMTLAEKFVKKFI